MDLGTHFNSFFETWKKVLLEPEPFFTEWDQNEPWEKVLIFNVICGLVAGILTTIFTLFSGIFMISTFTSTK